ncbi:MAG TPA: hypothetical protein VIU13_13425 [Chryseolinea sp.]
MKDRIFSLTCKYALILAGLYFLSDVYSIVLTEFKPGYDSLELAPWWPIINFAFSLLLNVVTVLFLSYDIRRHDVKTKYVIVTTILFRPVGVFVFLLFLFYQDRFVAQIEEPIDD